MEFQLSPATSIHGARSKSEHAGETEGKGHVKCKHRSRSWIKCSWQRRRGLTRRRYHRDRVGRWSPRPSRDHQDRPVRPDRPRHHPTRDPGDRTESNRTIDNRRDRRRLVEPLFTSRSKSQLRRRAKRSTRADTNTLFVPRVKGARVTTIGVEIRGKGGTVRSVRSIEEIPSNRTPPLATLPLLRRRVTKKIVRLRIGRTPLTSAEFRPEKIVTRT